MSSFFENRIPSLAALSLLKAGKYFSPEEIKEKLIERNIGNPQEVMAIALENFCMARATPDYFTSQQPLSHRKIERILELFTFLERPYAKEVLSTQVVQLKKELSACKDNHKQDLLRTYVHELLETSLLTERATTFFLILNAFKLRASRYLDDACAIGNKEVVKFILPGLPCYKSNAWNLKALTEQQKRLLKSEKNIIFRACEGAIRAGTMSVLFPIFEEKLPVIFKKPSFVERLLICAAGHGDEEFVRLLVEKGVESEEALLNALASAQHSGFKDVAVYLGEILDIDGAINVVADLIDPVQADQSLNLDRFVISDKVDLKRLSDFLHQVVFHDKTTLYCEEHEQILRLFFSSEEWNQFLPIRQAEKERLLSVLDAQKGNAAYRDTRISCFIFNALLTAVATSSSEGFRLLLILLASYSAKENKFLKLLMNEACSLGQQEMVRSYLDIIPSDELQEFFKPSIEHGRLEIVKMLVDAGAPINGNFMDMHTMATPLSFAAEWGKNEIVDYLLQKAFEKEMDIKNLQIHFNVAAARRFPLDYALRGGDKKAISSLFGSTVSGSVIDQCSLVIKSGNLSLVRWLLRQIPDVNVYNMKGDCLHLVAIKHGRLAMLKVLIHQYKADLSKNGLIDRESSLELAARQKNPKLLPYVIANIDKKTIERDKQEALRAAVRSGYLSNVSCLLEHGAVVDKTVIGLAMDNGDFKTFRMLLSHCGSAFTEKDEQGHTLLHKAILSARQEHIHGSASILAYLLVQSAVEDANLIYVQNNEGKTPLQLALEDKEVDNTILIELFLKKDPSLKPKGYVEDEKASKAATALIDIFKAEQLHEVD